MGFYPLNLPLNLPIDKNRLRDRLPWPCAEALGRFHKRPKVGDVLSRVDSIGEPPNLKSVVVDLLVNNVRAIIGAMELRSSCLTSEGHSGYPDLVTRVIRGGSMGFVPFVLHLVGFPTDVISH